MAVLMPMTLSGHVNERAAGVAGVDGGVGLNEGLELAVGNDVAAFGGDDAGGDGFLQSERTADGQDPIADLHAVGVAEFGGRERMIDVNLNNGQIGFLIHADEPGVMTGGAWGFIPQLDANAIGLFDYVAVGHDVALGIHDHAGTERALADGACVRAALTALAAEELVEKILERGVVIAIALNSGGRARRADCAGGEDS